MRPEVALSQRIRRKKQYGHNIEKGIKSRTDCFNISGNTRSMHEGVCHVEAKSYLRDLWWNNRCRDERLRRYSGSAGPEPIDLGDDCRDLDLGDDSESVDYAGAVASRSWLGLGASSPLAQNQLAQPSVVGRPLESLVSPHPCG
jgi:hypothetical protein